LLQAFLHSIPLPGLGCGNAAGDEL